ncbi:MAG: hypothetical protein IJS61_00360 [Firmicutes bacterium]|nr:hypothetical protein [Bacillota bacterium]
MKKSSKKKRFLKKLALLKKDKKFVFLSIASLIAIVLALFAFFLFPVLISDKVAELKAKELYDNAFGLLISGNYEKAYDDFEALYAKYPSTKYGQGALRCKAMCDMYASTVNGRMRIEENRTKSYDVPTPYTTAYGAFQSLSGDLPPMNKAQENFFRTLAELVTDNYQKNKKKESDALWEAEEKVYNEHKAAHPIPYEGMDQDYILYTGLGRYTNREERSSSDNPESNSYPYNTYKWERTIYTWEKNGYIIFSATCEKGKVVSVSDHRQDPIKSQTPTPKNNSSKNGSSSKNNSHKDPYDKDLDAYMDDYSDIYDNEDDAYDDLEENEDLWDDY